jgi:hypothetical protein
LPAASSHWGLAIDQTLGAETVLAGRGRNARGRRRLALADERPVLALLSTAYGRPVAAHAVAKMRSAAELWNEGEKALTHIYLAYIGLPPCDGEEQILRLFLAEERLAAGCQGTQYIMRIMARRHSFFRLLYFKAWIVNASCFRPRRRC